MFKGANAQALVAMSLFLQNIQNENFSHIELEADGFEDFNLVFKDGKKIICESKAWAKGFSFVQLKGVLENIAAKQSIAPKDEILIVCQKVDEQFILSVGHTAYFETTRNQFLQKGFSENLVALLPQVSFYNINEQTNKEIIYSLFAEAVGFWLPPQEVERVVNDLLFKKIFEGSAQGGSYSRQEILKQMADLAVETKGNSVHYDEQLKERDDQFQRLELALKDPQHSAWKPKELSAFSTDYERLFFAKTYLADKTNELSLPAWDPLWQLNRLYPLNFGLFQIFRNNLHTKENIDYVLSFIKRKLKSPRSFYREDFLQHDVLVTVKKILNTPGGDRCVNEVFDIARGLISEKKNEYFYVKSVHGSRGIFDQDEVCKLLKEIYDQGETALRNKIFKLIAETFNLAEDDSNFSHRAPQTAFEIVEEWLDEDFFTRFPRFIELMVNQYNRFYRRFSRKTDFRGWEHAGGGISYAGTHYHISDRHFITRSLMPAIKKHYDQNRKKTWTLIKAHCISTEPKVSKKRPDFLNRAVYKIILERYASNEAEVYKEAFEILKDFVLHKRGIPHKSDLVFQALGQIVITSEKRWRLTEVVIKKYKLPINPFVEQIVSELAKEGFTPALSILKGWYSNSEYYGQHTIEVRPVENIRTLLDTNLDAAVELFRSLVSSDHVKSDKGDYFGAFDISSLLNSILKKDYNAGLSILRSLENESQLSTQQQIVYTYSLFNHRGNDSSDNLDHLMRIYNDVVDPFLESQENDITLIYKRLPWDTCREAFVQFAARLVDHKKIEEALRIIRIFIDDQDPRLPDKSPKEKNSEHERIAKGEEPHTITSTRGWCGWILMKCAVLEGREYMGEVIQLTEKLITDENYYVVHMGCHALAQLATNRLSVIPDNRDRLLMSDDLETGLRMAKRIESIASDLLDRLVRLPVKAQEGLAGSVLYALSPIRSLNEADALRLVENLIKLPDEESAEAASILIFFAEFRKEAYTNWKLSLPGLYDDLGPKDFDQKKFKKIVLDTIKRLQQTEPNSCFKFAAVVEHLMRDPSIRWGSQDRYDKLALEYFGLLSEVYSHDVYTLIYQVIQDKFRTIRRDQADWHKLLMKCLKIEKDYYLDAVKEGRLNEVYWYPTLYHSGILTALQEKVGDEAFLSATKIFFSFPEQINLHESDELVAVIQRLSSTNADAKTILDILIKKHPTKYRLLRNDASSEIG